MHAQEVDLCNFQVACVHPQCGRHSGDVGYLLLSLMNGKDIFSGGAPKDKFYQLAGRFDADAYVPIGECAWRLQRPFEERLGVVESAAEISVLHVHTPSIHAEEPAEGSA